MRGFSSSRFGGFFGGKTDRYREERPADWGGYFFIVKGRERVFKGRGRKHGKDQWENLGIQKPVEIFSPEGSVSRYVYCRPLLDSDYPFDV